MPQGQRLIDHDKNAPVWEGESDRRVFMPENVLKLCQYGHKHL